MHKTKIDIPETKRTQLVQLLNEHLANAIDLQLQAKQARWNVRGPNFIALHELFDSVTGTDKKLWFVEAHLQAER